MKLPISKRLLACAGMVRAGAKVADVGADHGYLGIYLLQQGIAENVVATDLRPLPISKAKDNAEAYGVADRMEFICTDGLCGVDPACFDTAVMAGMGSDTMIGIIEAAPWLQAACYTLLLSPQASGQDLRKLLWSKGFSIERELLCRDGGFLYTIMEAQYCGKIYEPTPGEQFLSLPLRHSGCPELEEYAVRLLNSMDKTIVGMKRGTAPAAKLDFYAEAQKEIAAWLETYRRYAVIS